MKLTITTKDSPGLAWNKGGRMTRITKLVQLRLQPDLHNQIKQAAAADGRSLANWIARVCERAIKESEGKNDN